MFIYPDAEWPPAADEERILLEQNQRIKSLNRAPDDFPAFIRKGNPSTPASPRMPLALVQAASDQRRSATRSAFVSATEATAVAAVAASLALGLRRLLRFLPPPPIAHCPHAGYNVTVLADGYVYQAGSRAPTVNSCAEL